MGFCGCCKSSFLIPDCQAILYVSSLRQTQYLLIFRLHDIASIRECSIILVSVLSDLISRAMISYHTLKQLVSNFVSMHAYLCSNSIG